jgi:Transposase DDE domain
MRIAIARPLFDWSSLEDSPTLASLREVLASIPDGKLLDGLRQHRGRGRDDYPVTALWGVVLLTVLLRHKDFESCLAELRRNEGLRRLIDIDDENRVPKKWNVSRFLAVLGSEPHRTRLVEVFDQMARCLSGVVSGLGRHLAGDATALRAQKKPDAAAQRAETAEGLPQPSGGRKEYLDDAGNVTSAYEWFGYKLHLLVDVKHEVALAYRVTAPSAGDGETLPTVLAKAQANLPAGRIQTLAYDKAADSNDVHELLSRANIKPLIQTRALWKTEPERMLPGHDGRSNIVYDEAGSVYCYDRTSTPMVRHPMSFTGYEASRGTLKYRCPAVHEGWPCPSEAACNAGRPFGKTVRVKCDIDLRRFPPIPRATKQFERRYKGRTAIERVNGRLKVFWGADDGNIVGARRFHAFVGVVMVAHLAFATQLAAAPRREGTLGKMRLSPIARKLRQVMRK